MRDGQLCKSTTTAPHTMLAVKALQSTVDVLPLATPHIYTPTNCCAALPNGWVHTKLRRIRPLAYKNAAPPIPRRVLCGGSWLQPARGPAGCRINQAVTQHLRSRSPCSLTLPGSDDGH